jgi:hypothetical protein
VGSGKPVCTDKLIDVKWVHEDSTFYHLSY